MNKLIQKTTKSGLLAAALMASISASSETIEVKTLKYAGPYAVAQPWMADSVNIKGEAFDLKQLLDSPLSFTLLNKGKEVSAAQLLADKQDALHLASFCVSNTQRTKATIAVEGLEQYRLFVDGEQVAVNGNKAETILTPSQHTVVIKYLTRKNASSDKKSIKLTVTAANGAPLSVGDAAAKRAYNIYDVICAPNYPSVSISPNGKFIVVRKTWVDRKGNNHSVSELRNSQTNRLMATFEESVKWMPSSNKLYFTQKASDSSIAGEEKQDGTLQLITINPLTMEREVLASHLPEGWFQFTPDEKTLIYTLTTEGRKKDPQVYDHEQGTGRFSRFGRDAEIVIPERENEAVPSLPEKFSYGFVAAKPFGPRQSVLRHVNPSLNQHPYADILRHAPPSGMYAKLQKRDRPAKRHTLLPNSLSVSGSRPYYACFAFLSAGACSGLRGRALRPGFTSCAFRNSAALPLPFTTTGESSWPLFILPM